MDKEAKTYAVWFLSSLAVILLTIRPDISNKEMNIGFVCALVIGIVIAMFYAKGD